MRRLPASSSRCWRSCCCASGAFGSLYRNGAEIVSASLERLEQGDERRQFATISKDGRYVAFQTRARNFFADDDPDPPGHYRVGGIFRRDLVTGALELVADGDLKSSSRRTRLAVVRGAQNPSLNADGRYVVVRDRPAARARGPEPQHRRLCPRHDGPDSLAGAYEFVSARDGGTVPARHTHRRAETWRADITRGRAISADGQKVVFKTTTASDLPAASGPTATPTQQVFVRDRAARSTTLVTLTNEPPAGQTEPAPAGGADGGAVISADGRPWPGRAERVPGSLDRRARPDALHQRRVPRPRGSLLLLAPDRRWRSGHDTAHHGCGRSRRSRLPARCHRDPGPTITGPCYGPSDRPRGRAVRLCRPSRRR